MIKEIVSKSILNVNKNPSYWFGVKYYANLYRGCSHHCIYCDSRSECYRLDNFDIDIYIKTNAISLLRQELASKRFKEVVGFGSMSDPYLHIEKEYLLTRKALEVIKEFGFPVFILTKSDLVVRDADILSKINDQNYACVAFTITTASDELAKKIEPNAPLPSKRLEAMKILSRLGIKVGVMMSPILPFIEDNEQNIIDIIEKAYESGASFIYPSFGVTLRDRQREYFYDKLDESFPGIKNSYQKLYFNDYSCKSPLSKTLKDLFYAKCRELNIDTNMPSYNNLDQTVQLSLFDLQQN